MALITEALSAALKNGDVDAVKNWLNNSGDVEEQFLGRTPLLLCTHERGHIHADVIRLLLDQGAKVNVEDSRGRSPLHWVVRHCDESSSHLEIIRWLIDKGAEVNLQDKDGKTPLYLAIQNKNIDIFKLLLRKKADCDIQDKMGRSPLHYVMCNYDIFPNNVKFVKSLLDAGADINFRDNNGKTATDLAFEKGITILELTLLLGVDATSDLWGKYGSFPLHYIVNSNWNDFNVPAAVAKSMIERGVDVNRQDYDGNTPLHLAMMRENRVVVSLLLESGASVDVKNKSGLSPLQCVLNRCDESIRYMDLIKSLINRGVDVNIQDNDGNTPIHLALIKRNSAVVRLFLDSEANVNIQNNSGRSPLHYVLNHCLQFSSHVEDVKSLIEKDADVNMVDHDGNTPLHLFLKSIRMSWLSGLSVHHFPGAEQSPAYRPEQSVMDMRNKINNIITLLLDNGANVNIPNNDGVSLLHYAVFKHSTYRLDITKIIISRTTDVNVQDNKGQTPLHWCIGPNLFNYACLSTLLDWGGSMQVEDKNGKKPLHYLSTLLLNKILINKCLTQYMQRVKSAGLVNDVEEVELPKDYVTFNASYQLHLLNELEQMKQDKVGWSTMHHVFASYQDPLYVDDSDLSAAVDENKYLLYGELLKSTFAKAKRRKVLLDRAVNCFNIPIPVETIRMSLSYLDCSDILSLVTSYDQVRD